jgi:replicative DNA helicase
VSQGWNWQEGTDGQVQVEICPFCKKGDYKFFMNTTGNKDGLYMCFHGSCQKSGNLRSLQEELGLRIKGVDSRGEWAKGDRKVDALPDPDTCHNTLMGDADALDYLLNVRGFTQEIIDRQKIGLVNKHYFKEAGEVRGLVIPYLVNGNCVYAKYRTLPPSPKDFTSPTGHDAPLYNQEILVEGINEVVFVEGEANVLCLMSQGIENAVGVPGANFKKAAWIETLDRLAPEKQFILYDGDKAGIKAAQALASRVGYDKCLRMVLPEFYVTVPLDECKLCDDNGVLQQVGRPAIDFDPPICDHQRLGKDVNEWFTKGGGTVEEFNKLKENAQLFDVTGVTATGDALDEMERELEGKESLEPTYKTPWEPLSKLLGWENGDVIDIMAEEKIGKTTFGLNIMEFEVDTYDEDGLVICLEMTQARLARKWVCHVTGTDDSLPKTKEQAVANLQKLKAAIPIARAKAAGRKGDLYFAYPQNIKEPEDVFKLIRDCVRRYGVKWVMFDNVQLLCDLTLKNQAYRPTQLSQISKGFAKLAKDYQIKLIRILQPKKIAAGQIAGTGDTDGSGAIAKDCDCMILLHRNPVAEIKKGDWETAGYLETEQAFDSKMLVRVGLSRYSSGGATTLDFDGGTSTVRVYNMSKRTEMDASKPSTNGYELPTEQVILPTTKVAVMAAPVGEMQI